MLEPLELVQGPADEDPVGLVERGKDVFAVIPEQLIEVPDARIVDSTVERWRIHEQEVVDRRGPVVAAQVVNQADGLLGHSDLRRENPVQFVESATVTHHLSFLVFGRFR